MKFNIRWTRHCWLHWANKQQRLLAFTCTKWQSIESHGNDNKLWPCPISMKFYNLCRKVVNAFRGEIRQKGNTMSHWKDCIIYANDIQQIHLPPQYVLLQGKILALWKCPKGPRHRIENTQKGQSSRNLWQFVLPRITVALRMFTRQVLASQLHFRYTGCPAINLTNQLHFNWVTCRTAKWPHCFLLILWLRLKKDMGNEVFRHHKHPPRWYLSKELLSKIARRSFFKHRKISV